MSSTITFNGVSYSVPATGDENWSDSLSLYLIAIASGALQKTGGTFTLTAETDFGATYGLKSAYYKSRATNPSSTGIVRLGNTESIAWRNAANSADYALKVNASNQLEYNGTVLASTTGASFQDSTFSIYDNSDITKLLQFQLSGITTGTTRTLTVPDASTTLVGIDTAQTLTNKTLTSPVMSSITNTGTLTLPTSTDTLVGKATTDTFTNKSIDATTNTLTNIANASVAAAAAIALSKLAATTASRALVSDASGFVTAATTTATEIGYVNGVTSAIQTQINDKAPIASPTFTGTSTVAQLIDSGLTADTVPYANASKQLTSSAVTPTELGYVSGVTSAIQTQINAISATTVPSGQISMYGGSSAPSGYLLCDGSAVSRTTYAALFTAISTTFGVGNGTTTFNVPDIRGIFVRGAGTHGTLTNANGTAFSGTLGTQENDKMQGHAHSGNFPQVNGSHVNDVGTGTLYGTGSTNSASIGNPSTDGANGTPRTGTETNPANISLTYIIKT